MGALPDRLPGFQHVENDALRAKFDAEWGVPVPPKRGWHLSGMFDAIERGDLTARLLHRREPGPVRGRPEARDPPAREPRLPRRPGPVPDQDRRTRRCRLPGDRGLGGVGGHGHQLRAARPARAQGGRTTRRCTRRPRHRVRAGEPDGRGLGRAGPGDRLGRGPSPVPGPRRDELQAARGTRGGLQWPCYDEQHPGELFLHSRLWEDPVPGNRVPFVPVDHDPPVDKLDDDYPIRLTTGRRLDSYNTGVQTAGYTSPLRRGESLDISPEDAHGLRPPRR